MAGGLDASAAFDGGAKVAERMATIRKEISHIRRNWAQYDTFMVGLTQGSVKLTSCDRLWL